MFVTRPGVGELRFLNEQGQVEGEVQDLFLVQDTFPKSHDAQKLFCMKNMATGLQATFFCYVCQCPVLSFPNMAIHCSGKMHIKKVGEAGGQGGGGAVNVGGGDVNPYHQAWVQAADERLSLVYDWGVANILMGDDVVDLYDFQQNQKEFPVDFFKKDLRTGSQRLFNCIVCGVTLAEEGLVRAHCVSRDHTRMVGEKKRMEKRAQQGEKRKDKRKLREVLEGVEEAAIGLEQITEWWPGMGREGEPPVYSCQLCGDWAGWGGDMARHVVGERHRREQLVSRYPVLEGMIKDMDRVELGERAREEEEKHQRRYDVIQSMVDGEKYEELVMRSEGGWGAGGRGGWSQRGKFDNGENNPQNWESGPGYGRGTFGNNRGKGPGQGLLAPPPGGLVGNYGETMPVNSNVGGQQGWNQNQQFGGNNDGRYPGNMDRGHRGQGGQQRGQFRGHRGGQFGDAVQHNNQFGGNRGQFGPGYNRGSRGNFANQESERGWGRGAGARGYGGPATRGQFVGQGHMRGQFNGQPGQFVGHSNRGQFGGQGYQGQFGGQEEREEFNNQNNRGQYGGHRGQPGGNNNRGGFYGQEDRGNRTGYGGHQNNRWNHGNQGGPAPLMKLDIPGPDVPVVNDVHSVDDQMMGRPHRIMGNDREQEDNWRAVGEIGNKPDETEASQKPNEPEGANARLHPQDGFGRGGRGTEGFGRGGLRGRRKSRDDGFAGGFTRGGAAERPRGFGRQRGFGRAGAFSNLGLGFGRGSASAAPGFGRGSAKAGVSPGRGNRTLDEDDDLPEACYAVSAEVEETDDKKDKEKSKQKADDKEGGKKRSYSPEHYPEDGYYDQDEYGYDYQGYDGYDDYRDLSSHYNQRYYGPDEEEDYWGLHGVRKVGQVGREYDLSRGSRPDSRYYGPQEGGWRGRRREAGPAEDAPYEGPTIFDKVFRTKKKGEDESGGRGERERDQEMEREWRRYKERTEARIRREKEKLERYERRIKELQGGEGEASTSARDGSKRRKKHRRSHDNSPPRAYTNRPAYTSSESDREDSLPPPPPPPLDSPPTSPAATPTPPPGSTLAPVLSPTLADSDKAQTKFDPY